MNKINPENERIKRQYFRWVIGANRKNEKTLDCIRKSIQRFEEYNKFKDFKTFNQEQAIGFKKRLQESMSQRNEGTLSKSTVLKTLNQLKDFFKWLSFQPGYKSRINKLDIEYFNLPEKETRIAMSSHHSNFPTVHQIQHVILNMPTETEVQRRDRALLAFFTLTGIRVTAAISLKIKHIDLESRLVNQDSREVETKFGKTMHTHFFPVGESLVQIFKDWMTELKEKKLFGMNDPVFPKTKLKNLNQEGYQVIGIEPEHWNSTTPVREIFKKAFETAGLPYHNPHSFRHTLAHLGEKVCQTPEEFKAWSQSLGHSDVLTTFNSYGNINVHRQGEILMEMAEKKI